MSSSATPNKRRRTTTVTETKRKTISESPARSSSAKKTRRSSTSKTATAPAKTPTKRKPSTTRARSASAGRSAKKSRKQPVEDDDEDEDMEEDDEEGQSNSHPSSIAALQHRVADAVRYEYDHLGSNVKDTVAGAKKTLDAVKERALHAFADVREASKKSTKGRKKKSEEEDEEEGEDEEEEEEQSSRTSRRKPTPAAVRHSSRTSTRQSTAATEGLQRSRVSGGGGSAADSGEVTMKNGVELRRHKADISHLTQYHPEGTVIQSWRDVGQVAPHMILHLLLLLFLHWFIASAFTEDFKFRSYEWFRPRILRNILFPRWFHHVVFEWSKKTLTEFPLVWGALFSTVFFFRASVRSVLLRHAETSIKDCDYHSGAFTAYFSRFAYGVVHMAFIALYWGYYTRSTNILDLQNVVFWINFAYWAQDAFVNLALRPQSQTDFQMTSSFLLAFGSLVFALLDSPVPSSLGSWTALIKPTVAFVLLASVFASSLYSAFRFIKAHSDFSPLLKMATWAFVFVVYTPLSVAFVLVPALASLSDVVFHVLFPGRAHWVNHAQYTKTPHQKGSPA